MGYAITVDRVLLGNDLRARLAHVIEPQLEAARQSEVDQFLERLFDGAAHRREVPIDALAQLKVAANRAQESEVAYIRQSNIAVRARLLFAESPPEKAEGVAAHLTASEASAERTKETWEAHKTAHLALKERFKAQLDPVLAIRVREAFDRQIRLGLNAVEIIVDGEAHPFEAVRFQISGHVEDNFYSFPHVNVWPVE